MSRDAIVHSLSVVLLNLLSYSIPVQHSLDTRIYAAFSLEDIISDLVNKLALRKPLHYYFTNRAANVWNSLPSS